MNYFKDLNTKLITAFKRFPVVLSWAVLGSVFCLIVSSDSWFGENNDILLTLVLGVSWLLGTRFLIETLTFKYRKILIVIPLILLGLFYWDISVNLKDIPSLVNMQWTLYLLAGHVFLFFAPFVRQWNANAFWNYLRDILGAIGRSVLFSLVLFLGLILAVFAIESLFQVDFSGDIYSNIFIICLGIVNTFMYTYDFPKDIQTHKTIHFNKPLEVFVKNILVPLLLLYFVILYLYAFKIMIDWELPKGWVSSLISVLAVLGFVIHIVIYPVRKTHSSLLLRRFHPWFFILLAPLILLLFIAVGKRLNEYGFTEARYLLLALSFWILSMILYFLFSKKKELRILPISVFILLVFSSFGPWGAFQISIKSQKSTLQNIYNRIDFEQKTITAEDSKQFADIVGYLKNRGQLKDLDDLLNIELQSKYQEIYNPGNMILNDLGLKRVRKETDEEGRVVEATEAIEENYHKRYHNFERNTIIDKELSRYDYFVQVSSFDIEEELSNYRFEEKDGVFIFKNKNENLFQLDITKDLIKLTRGDQSFYETDPEELEFYVENKNGMFDIIITDINFQTDLGNVDITRVDMMIFFKLNP